MVDRLMPAVDDSGIATS